MATSPESVTVSWDPPPPDAHNGVITSYNLFCQYSGEDVASLPPMKFPVEGEYDLDGFIPAATYNCTVLAITAGGSGPPATQIVTLLDDGTT